MNLMLGVECIIINSNKKILLTQRAPQKSHSYQWEIPGGCSVSGEISNQTLERELSEEIGINVTNYEFIATKLYKTQFLDIYKTLYDIDINKLKLQKEEVIQAKWFSLNELIKLKEKNSIVPSTLIFFEIIEEILKEGVLKI